MSRERTSSAPDGPHHEACIAVGSNLGDRAENVRRSIDAIARIPGTFVRAASRVYETAPVGGVAQGPYLNGAVVVETGLAPRELLGHLLRIEREAGRDRARERRWGPRALDLDLVLFGDVVIDEPDLTVPHARMHERLFVLDPLAEVAPHAVHPVLGKSVLELRDGLVLKAPL